MFLTLLIAMFGLAAVKGAMSSQFGSMTPKQRLIFHGLISSDFPTVPAEELTAWASKFDQAGLRAEARLLRKRATIASLPAEKLAQIKEVVSIALRSRDPVAMRVLANTCEAQGFFGNARMLREQANNQDIAAALAIAQAQAASLEAQRAAVMSATPTEFAKAQAAAATASSPPGAIGSVPLSAVAVRGTAPVTAQDIIRTASPAEIQAAKAALAAEMAKVPGSASPQAPTAGVPTANYGPNVPPPPPASAFAPGAPDADNQGRVSPSAQPTGAKAGPAGKKTGGVAKMPTSINGPEDIQAVMASATPEELAAAKAALAAEMAAQAASTSGSASPQTPTAGVVIGNVMKTS